jgi:hypothetical protein
MNTKHFLGLVTWAAIGMASISSGQGMFVQRRAKDLDENLVKFLGKNLAFSANAHVTITSSTGKEVQEMEFRYTMLDGKVRTDMDMSKMHNGDLPPRAMERMKQMGMDRSTHIFLPSKNVSYMMYPSMKAYCELTPEEKPEQKEGKPPKFEETELGKDTIDGHPCMKSKVVVTDEDGGKSEVLVWRATDLNNFPIQTQMLEDERTITTRFTDINRSKPSASLFEPPADFKRYANMQELMMSNMQRMMPPEGMPPRNAMPPRGGDNE